MRLLIIITQLYVATCIQPRGMHSVRLSIYDSTLNCLGSSVARGVPSPTAPNLLAVPPSTSIILCTQPVEGYIILYTYNALTLGIYSET